MNLKLSLITLVNATLIACSSAAIGTMLQLSVAPLTARPTDVTICASNRDATDVHQNDELIQHLNTDGKPPEDYVVSKFQNHQIVLLGEIHEVRETCQFVASLIKPLDEANVKRLCIEYLPSRVNDRLHEIITAEEYDEAAVVQLFRESAWPTWGYREYMEIIRAVWQVNHDRESGTDDFLAVGIDSDWKQVELLKADPQSRFETLVQRENHMTQMIRDTAQNDQKVLVHIGFAHTVRHGIRVAEQLSDDFGDKLFQVVMHHRLTNMDREAPITATIEAAVKESRFEQVGFDVASSPFATLEDPRLASARMLQGDASLGALAQGLIYLNPVGQLSRVTWVEGFIIDETFPAALQIARKNRWISEDDHPKSASELDQLLRQRYSHN